METNYTPGPWRYDPNYFGDVQTGDGKLEIACTNSNVLSGGDCPNRSQQKANARLIAAAPDLLEALQKCDLAFACWQIGAVPGRPEDILALTAQVRAAITKATGA